MMHKTLLPLTCALVLSAAGASSMAAVSQQQASRLGGSDLTPFGSPRAGSEDGVIPAWEGGLSLPPDHVDYAGPGSFHPNPFPDDEVLFSISVNNMEAFSEHLTPGTQALMETYPETYRLNVYPSRRTHALPEWVMKNTRENAVKARLVNNGNGIENAYGGTPFPILHGSNEEKAMQAMWNHLTHWRGIFGERRTGEVAVTQGGDYSLTMSRQEFFFNFYNPELDADSLDNTLFYYLSSTTSPARLAGGAVLVHETMNQVIEPRRAWGYNSGQRRVRRAPNLAYDSPIAASENLRTADETDLFNGALNRYNWEYQGLQPFYIPYNNYDIAQEGLPYDEILGTSHVNPDLQRWERHYVHVVEANLKEGERHIFSRRVFYIDADSWKVVSVDQYDGRGELWRVSQAMNKNYYELPGVWSTLDIFHDLQSRRYHVQGLDTEEGSHRVFYEDRIPNPRYFSPQALRRRGVR